MSPRHSNIPSLRIQTKMENETFEDEKYFEWYNPVIQKYMNGELTEYELVNEIFEPFEQVSQIQAQLLGAAFEMLSGGPAQTHVGTGGGGSSSDMPWGERKRDSNMGHSNENANNWFQTNKKTNFFQMRIADFRRIFRESAILFIILCPNIDNSTKRQLN